jgi:hypothetical protein
LDSRTLGVSALNSEQTAAKIILYSTQTLPSLPVRISLVHPVSLDLNYQIQGKEMLKVALHRGYPPEEGRYIRGNDFSPVAYEYLKNSKRKKGDEVRWKERGPFVYFFSVLLFWFFLHAILVMFQILNLT